VIRKKKNSWGGGASKNHSGERQRVLDILGIMSEGRRRGEGGDKEEGGRK